MAESRRNRELELEVEIWSGEFFMTTRMSSRIEVIIVSNLIKRGPEISVRE